MTALSTKLRRKALHALSRGALAAITTKLDLPVADRRSQGAHVDAIVKDKGIELAGVLRLLSRDDLKAICAALDLDPSGKEKEPIAQRILDAVTGGGAQVPAPAEAERAPAPSRGTSTSRSASSGFRRKPGGAATRASRRRRSRLASARSSTPRWSPSSATTRRSRACSRRVTAARSSINSGSASSWT